MFYKTKGNNYRCPTKGAENGHLQAERRALEDILANDAERHQYLGQLCCLIAV